MSNIHPSLYHKLSVQPFFSSMGSKLLLTIWSVCLVNQCVVHTKKDEDCSSLLILFTIFYLFFCDAKILYLTPSSPPILFALKG